MTDPVSLLSACWTLICVISDVVDRIEQSRERGRALLRLYSDAGGFLEIVNERLICLNDISPYRGTILRLELLLQDILDACTGYSKKSWLGKVAQANSSKENILALDRRLRGFVDTYLIRTATETILNLDTLANNEPRAPRALVPNDLRWEMISSAEGVSMLSGPTSLRSKVDLWRRAVRGTPTTPSLPDSWALHSPAIEPPSPSAAESVSGPPPTDDHVLPPSPSTSPSISQGARSMERLFSGLTNSVNFDNRQAQAITDPSIASGNSSTPVARTSITVADEYITYCDLVKIALEDPNAQRYFPLIFSIAENFECVLNELHAVFQRHLLLDTSGKKLRILHLVTGLARELWLAQKHRSLVLKRFGPESNSHVPDITIAANSLSTVLQPILHEDTVSLVQLLVCVHERKVNAIQIAEALAILEDDLRRADPLGECVRWLARRHRRDLLSFPERVKSLVLHSISIVKPEAMKECCDMFYRVANHSKEIENFSAMRAIVSALISLKQLRMETSFGGAKLDMMARLSCVKSIRKSKTLGKPCLSPLPDIFASYPVDFHEIVDDDQRIRWTAFKDLCLKVDKHTSQKDFPFNSPQPYPFSQSQLVTRVRNILINVVPMDAGVQDRSAAGKYRAANVARRMF